MQKLGIRTFFGGICARKLPRIWILDINILLPSLHIPFKGGYMYGSSPNQLQIDTKYISGPGARARVQKKVRGPGPVEPGALDPSTFFWTRARAPGPKRV